MIDTAELITLRVAQQMAFDDMRDVIIRKRESLSRYAEKPDARQNYIDSENNFLLKVSGYVDATESLMEQVDKIKDYSDQSVHEALRMLEQATEMIFHHNPNGQEQTH